MGGGDVKEASLHALEAAKPLSSAAGGRGVSAQNRTIHRLPVPAAKEMDSLA